MQPLGWLQSRIDNYSGGSLIRWSFALFVAHGEIRVKSCGLQICEIATSLNRNCDWLAQAEPVENYRLNALHEAGSLSILILFPRKAVHPRRFPPDPRIGLAVPIKIAYHGLQSHRAQPGHTFRLLCKVIENFDSSVGDRFLSMIH
jgi:hypothetical protein